MAIFVFAHGAGAGPETEFMQIISANLEQKGHKVHRFAFPYWQKIEQSGKKRPPDKKEVLDAAFIAEVTRIQEGCEDIPLVVMGKSMGARVAFRCADKVNAVAAIGLGFPFHPPGKPEKHRLADLTNGRRRNFIVQGSRDPFGKPEWLAEQALPKNLRLHWVTDGNHDLAQPKRNGLTNTECWQLVSREIDAFVTKLTNQIN
ncbi:alpha/beta hydrolase [Aliidiomarina iranensis]|uniref:Alpha/beta hydrolase n=1 Tax=Aliidiomarina iranensis TaxID=1434071 RepID=A0A432W0P6_9GAMM|nr:alpha/beta family hydrolase [Aliidiomarina iranensis]RUO22563.1 alpha/beta hydrolase [Aliidiomarina iranensis]